MNERDLERSEAQIEQECEQSAKRTRAIVARTGTVDCIICGEPISKARRKAAPFAERCIECQTSQEREARLYG